jgi:DNA-binding NarL/FixJ family response regulator
VTHESTKQGTVKKRVFLVDDHPMIRERLAQLIEREPDLSVCGEAEDAPQAIAGILRTEPHVVVVDISLKSSSGLELIKDLQKQRPDLPILVLSMHDESLYAMRAVHAGASGYITKVAASREVLMAIRKVLGGGIYFSQAMQHRIVQQQIGRVARTADPLEQLTDRELEVFQLLGRGLETRRIAEELGIGVKSVEAYRVRLKEKLGVTNATELLFYAMQQTQGVR